MSTKPHTLLRAPLLIVYLSAINFCIASYGYTIGYRCTLGDSVRRIEVYYPKSPETLPCEVIYHKDTEAPNDSKTLWRAENDASYCEMKADNMIHRLTTEWGWQCDPQ